MAAVEMSVIRLMAAASLPGPEDAARLIAALEAGVPLPAQTAQAGGGSDSPSAQAVSHSGFAEPEIQPVATSDLSSLEDVLALLDREREVLLRDQVERFVRLVSVGQGKLVFEAAKGAPEDLASRLAGFLHTQTGARWLVDSQGRAPGGETLRERRRREADALRERALRDPAIVRAMTLFPGAELESVTPLETGAAPSQMTDAETQRQERKP